MSVSTQSGLAGAAKGSTTEGQASDASTQPTILARASKVPAYMFQFARWFSEQSLPVSGASGERALETFAREGPWQPYNKVQIELILGRTLFLKGFAQKVTGGYVPTPDLKAGVAAGHFNFQAPSPRSQPWSELKAPRP